MKRLITPLTGADVEDLRVGDRVLLSGKIYTARDAAHKKLIELIEQKEALPLDLEGQVIYYVGPAPARPQAVIGPAGPTTSYRMDPYTPPLLALGLKCMIGKGPRSPEVLAALKEHRAVYCAAVGGAAALLAKHIKQARVIAYPDLGTEALRELVVEDFPVIVVNDCHGGDLYEEGAARYRRTGSTD